MSCASLYDAEGMPRITQRITLGRGVNWMDVVLFNGDTITVHAGSLKLVVLDGMSAAQMLNMPDPTPVYDAMDRLMAERLRLISLENREALRARG